ncbi:hypothetical protein EG329_009962 [Mollisiaceae sp. DMI_Dod_QoI]|nr:hypothetical protein EG329_009962 [Helotiales sp. DMI_Dod_QoI]
MSQFMNWVIFILSPAATQTIQTILWNVPDGKLPDLSQTFTAGQTLPLSWNAYSSTQYVDTTKNLVDLWAAAFDFNLNPFTGINLTSPGNFAWTITIPNGNLSISAKYVLRFKITSPVFNPNNGDLSSPGFLVLQAAGSSSLPTTSSSRVSGSSSSASGAINTSTPAPVPTSGASAAPGSSGLSGGAKGGISAGVVVAALALGGFSFFFFARKRKREKEAVGSGAVAVAEDNKNGVVAGPAELPANGHQ